MPTPHVAGACALVMAHAPGLSCLEIKNRILARVDTKPGLSGRCLSGVRLNLYQALNPTGPLPQIITFHMDDPLANNGYFRTGMLNLLSTPHGPELLRTT